MRTALILLAVSATLATSAVAQCEGCKYDNSGWEGTAGNDHLW